MSYEVLDSQEAEKHWLFGSAPAEGLEETAEEVITDSGLRTWKTTVTLCSGNYSTI